MGKFGFAFSRQYYRYYVVSLGLIKDAVFSYELSGGVCYVSLFLFVNRIYGRKKLFETPGLNFNKYECAVFASCNKINFTRS